MHKLETIAVWLTEGFRLGTIVGVWYFGVRILSAVGGF
jgi:hypothetical protein